MPCATAKLRRQSAQAPQVDGYDESSSFVALLRSCARNKDIYRGTKLHNDIVKRGFLRKCLDALVTMYAKCGDLTKAKELFDLHKSRDVFTWTAVIAGYARKGHAHNALDCFEQMQHEGLSPNAGTFINILKVCGSLKAAEKGAKIHDDITKQGLFANNVALGTALVDMYAKCGLLLRAHQVLKELPERDVVSWNALIAGYAQHGMGEQALKCLEQMQGEGLTPDGVTFICILKACANLGAAYKGEEIHNEIAKQGLLKDDLVLGTALVDMYAKCGALAKAQGVLDELPVRDVVTWNALIAGYVQHGEAEQAIVCYEDLQRDGLSPSAATFISILKACGSIGAVDKGGQIHKKAADQGLLGKDVVLGTALVDMYAKCGALVKAEQVLKELPGRDVVSWNALIAGYTEHNQGEAALNCYEQLQADHILPNAATFTCILKACGSIKAADVGERVHDEIAKRGLLGGNISIGISLVNMYAKCGAFTKAQEVLEQLPVQDIVSWNALISGYVQEGQAEQALSCHERMQEDGLSPNAVTLACILKACSSLQAADKGERMHEEIARQGLLRKDIVLGTALVDMYANCGILDKAQQLLEELPVRDVVSYNALIAGYAKEGHGNEALKCLEQLQCEGFSPNEVTLLSILKACGSIGAVDKGEQFHDEIARQGLLANNIMLGNALVDMYAKCGALEKAQHVLKELPVRDAISWASLIAGYVQHGNGDQALSSFEEMQLEGLTPDRATFSYVLSTCSHLGLLDNAQAYLMNMSTIYGMKPDLGHFTCMLDVFGRSGHLDKAIRMIGRMPFPDIAVWCALLCACEKWGDVNVGRWAFERAVHVDKYDAAAYAFMANIYAAAGMQEHAKDIAALRVENNAWDLTLHEQFKNSTHTTLEIGPNHDNLSLLVLFL